MNMNLREADNHTSNFLAALGMTVVESWGYVLEVFLHRRFGHRYRDSRAGWGLCLLLFFALCWEGHDLSAFIWFSWAYLALNLLHKIGAGVRMMRGPLVHSNYTGWPIFKWTLPMLTEAQFKLWVEPPAIVLTGGLIAQASPPVGVFCVIAGFILFFKNADDHMRRWRRMVAINDSMIDSQITLERFRGQVGVLN